MSIARRASLLALAIAGLLLLPAAAQADFGFRPGTEGFEVSALTGNGIPDSLAGTHPETLEVHLGLQTAGQFSDGDLRDLNLELPSGFLLNPTSIAECTQVAFHTPRVSPYQESLSGESCPNNTQIGVAAVHSSYAGGSTRYFGIFNLVPPFGSVDAIGFAPFGMPIVLATSVREADAGLDLKLENLSQALDIQSMDLTIWGTPWSGGDPVLKESPGHNPQRGNCLDEVTGGSFGQCLAFGSAPAPIEQIKSFLTMPTTPCGVAPHFALAATSWQGGEATADADVTDSEGNPVNLEKCNKPLSTANVQLMTESAASRTGLAFNLEVNDGGGIRNPGGTARPPISKATLSLPEGLTINPSLGSGLGTCTEADFAREAVDTVPGAGCPNASKVGNITIDGMLALPEPLTGSIFIAKPYQNPFGTLLAVYMVASNPRRGLFIKAQGRIEPDPRTGRLSITLEGLPRLLYTHLNVTFREGQRSVMVSPTTCGSYPSGIDMSSYADPNLIIHTATAFLITHGIAGGPCPTGAAPPFTPALEAGSTNPAAGAHTPFFLHMTRTDADQEITSYSAKLPPGLLGKIAGLPFCSDAAIEAAKARTGIEELESPSCPAASSIGHTLTGYGVGGVLAYAPGGLYLAGPYHGAPFSTVAIDSALVGPFDLGVVVVRSAIRVDPKSTQVAIDSAGSDPIPHILKGIPLHLRDIRVYIDRPDFTVNPTTCNPTQTISTLTGAGTDLFSSADDIAADSIDRFQVANCTLLPFKPKLKFRFTSGFKRRAFPSLRTELRANPGDANLHFVAVTLPRTEFIAQEHLRNFCTKAQFAANNCPPDSVYGKARAFTPLLDEPLEGPVYLRSSSSGGLPDMVFALSGRGGVQIEVPGKIDSVHESLRATFTDLPDAPVSRFIMTLYGGKQGLIQNEKNICNFPQFANARMIGQNNTGEAIKPHLETRCPKKKKSKRAVHRHGGNR